VLYLNDPAPVADGRLRTMMLEVCASFTILRAKDIFCLVVPMVE
jgi:hypothetical protein